MTLFILLIMILVTGCNTQINCVFTDIYGSGRQIDLRALAHTPLTGADFQYIYVLTPCRNGAGQCSKKGTTDTGMCIQTDPNNEEMCSIVANWDNGNIQPSFAEDDMKWTFKYENGNDCESQQGNYPRRLTIYYICNETIGDYYVLSAGEIGHCIYEYHIMTKWACPDEVYTTPIPQETIQLSLGTLCLMVFFFVLFIYFFCGWIISSFNNRKNASYDCIDNCPHSTFWSKLPSLVFHGCCSIKDILIGLLFSNPNKNTKANLLEMTE